MKISKNLLQFEGKRALISVTGRQEARFFLANDGTIEELESFKFDKPEDLKREGHNMIKGSKGVYRSGPTPEFKNQRIIAELEFHLRKSLKNILDKNKIDIIYLTVPDYLRNDVKKTFPAASAKKIKLVLLGDYCHFHPFDILKKIASRVTVPVVPLKESVSKILNKPQNKS
jgi:hypothetical protein